MFEEPPRQDTRPLFHTGVTVLVSVLFRCQDIQAARRTQTICASHHILRRSPDRRIICYSRLRALSANTVSTCPQAAHSSRRVGSRAIRATWRLLLGQAAACQSRGRELDASRGVLLWVLLTAPPPSTRGRSALAADSGTLPCAPRRAPRPAQGRRRAARRPPPPPRRPADAGVYQTILSYSKLH